MRRVTFAILLISVILITCYLLLTTQENNILNIYKDILIYKWANCSLTENIIYGIIELACIGLATYVILFRKLYKALFRISSLLSLFLSLIVFLLIIAIIGTIAGKAFFLLMEHVGDLLGNVFKLLSLFLGVQGWVFCEYFFFILFLIAFTAIDYFFNEEARKLVAESVSMAKEDLDEAGIMEVVDKIRRTTQLPPIEFYLHNSSAINAHVIGHAIVIESETLKQDRNIIQAIIAHEISHILNMDYLANCITNVPAEMFRKITYSVIWILSHIPIINLLRFIYSWIYRAVLLGLRAYRKVSWLISGRFYESKADLFATRIGYGIGTLMLQKMLINRAVKVNISMWANDNHPSSRRRYKKVLKFIIKNDLVPMERLQELALDTIPSKAV